MSPTTAMSPNGTPFGELSRKLEVLTLLASIAVLKVTLIGASSGTPVARSVGDVDTTSGMVVPSSTCRRYAPAFPVTMIR